ncbi:Ltp family lipoprotein [Mammaliicoccus vitulinus]|uniref:Ltp family lipoprotein n=1 Tax=Mammaliicoccus vitulinus TaxID=71237 RepID=UPI0033145C69
MKKIVLLGLSVMLLGACSQEYNNESESSSFNKTQIGKKANENYRTSKESTKKIIVDEESESVTSKVHSSSDNDTTSVSTSEAPKEEEYSYSAEESSESIVSITREQRNALDTANSYLEYAGFSETRLREQLEYEEFPQDAIDYAMDNIIVDWKEQALMSAESYDEYASMSDSRLYDQLIYEGFSDEEAQYAIDNLE